MLCRSPTQLRLAAGEHDARHAQGTAAPMDAAVVKHSLHVDDCVAMSAISVHIAQPLHMRVAAPQYNDIEH